jgi:hypothetical protein
LTVPCEPSINGDITNRLPANDRRYLDARQTNGVVAPTSTEPRAGTVSPIAHASPPVPICPASPTARCSRLMTLADSTSLTEGACLMARQ